MPYAREGSTLTLCEAVRTNKNSFVSCWPPRLDLSSWGSENRGIGEEGGDQGQLKTRLSLCLHKSDDVHTGGGNESLRVKGQGLPWWPCG